MPHAVCDVGLLEEGRAISFRHDQFIKLLDLVAWPYRKSVWFQLGGVANSFHVRASPRGVASSVHHRKAIRPAVRPVPGASRTLCPAKVRVALGRHAIFPMPGLTGSGASCSRPRAQCQG